MLESKQFKRQSCLISLPSLTYKNEDLVQLAAAAPTFISWNQREKECYFVSSCYFKI